MSTYQYFNEKRRKQTNGPSAAVIRYEDEGSAPKVVAQGRGRVANQIMELAKEHNVHLQEDASLLSNLLDMDLGDNIPPQLYSVMAEILLLIEEMEENY
ncbi:EscU/YscU/HrcU family type III secretion system export apparatus switch protein [Alkalicoccobacillus plakortidis]|uniref:EscU/YscU/HrcU family type III secretion system export apparatus switch protein n=1 Tax=Alkalicoccobacillus plakortidis TaxID=444060 RepID=A0ABT0XPC6_9BACI|nr:EscU/YscU/HrcU family type III secretion system export apparatus switch protein [Alkalicoccobacillus plakortidis]MCM2677763.1 EscU/YscU/HrcU family type III secretion system export apparatus switch protein [Alkalicoccobacillus plakortidis]